MPRPVTASVLLLACFVSALPLAAQGLPDGLPDEPGRDPFDKCLIAGPRCGKSTGGLIAVAEVQKLKVGEKLEKTVDLEGGVSCKMVFHKTTPYLGVLWLGKLGITIYDTKDGPDDVHYIGGLLEVCLSPGKPGGHHTIIVRGVRSPDPGGGGNVIGFARYDEATASFEFTCWQKGAIPVVRYNSTEPGTQREHGVGR